MAFDNPRYGQIYSPNIVDSSEINPIDALVFKNKNASLLDSVIISKAKKKPAWITITAGPATTMYAVGSDDGRLKEAAKIHWPSDFGRAKKSEVLVEIDGETFSAEKFGRTKGQFSGTPSEYHFLIGHLHCKWYSPALMGIYWECTATIPPAPKVAPSSSTSSSKWRSIFKSSPKFDEPKMLLARYSPPQALTRRDLGLDIFPNGVPYTFTILLSTILISSNSDDWKVMQSQRTAQEFEVIISSDLTGALPAYTAARDDTAPDLHPIIPATTTSRWEFRPPRPPRDRRSRTAPEYYPV